MAQLELASTLFHMQTNNVRNYGQGGAKFGSLTSKHLLDLEKGTNGRPP